MNIQLTDVNGIYIQSITIPALLTNPDVILHNNVIYKFERLLHRTGELVYKLAFSYTTKH